MDDLRTLVLIAPRICSCKPQKSKSLAAARKLAENCLNSGEPRQKWNEMLVAQGADLKAFNEKLAADSTAPVVSRIKIADKGRICFQMRCANHWRSDS